MEVISGIYQIKNLVNNKIYIGSSVDIFRRWRTHKAKLKNKTHQNPYLINAWHKYSEENFVFSVIEEVEPDKIIEREQYWLDTLQPYRKENGYNCATIAGSNWLGRTHTPETREKMSISQSNRPKRKLSKTHIENIIRKAKVGKKYGDDFRRKMSEVRKGMEFSDSHKENIRKSKLGNSCRKGKKLNEQQKEKISGENNASSKLKTEQVIEIKKMLNEGIHPKVIAPMFNVSVSAIKNIKLNKNWKNVSVC